MGQSHCQAPLIKLLKSILSKSLMMLILTRSVFQENFSSILKKKILRPSKDSLIRKTSKIDRVEHIENKLILQGVEEGVENIDDGLAWSITISKKTGRAILSASGDNIAYVLFGTCTLAENYQE